MFKIEDMYFRLKNTKYFEYLSLKSTYEDSINNISKEAQMEKWKEESLKIKPFMNKYDNRYLNINHINPDYLYCFIPNDKIIIQEKIDGANSHIIVTKDNFKCYGMNYELNEYNHLQGFYFWVKDNFKRITEKYYNLKIYGEWLIPHHCDYKDNFYCNFYVFDIMEDNKYWTQDKVELFCKECDFEYVPTLYKGDFISWEHVKSFIGKTKMGSTKGEGIVIKNMSKLNSPDKLFYLKLVDIDYQETNPSREIIKTIEDKELEKADYLYDLTASIVTLPRIRKQILKLVDAKLLPVNWEIIDTNKLLKLIKGNVIKDCKKEEPIIVDEIGKRFINYMVGIIKNTIEKLKNENI